MNFNEVVDQFPTGFPRCPVIAFGGSFGAQLLQQETFVASDRVMAETVMMSLLRNYNLGTSADLTILGLRKKKIAANNKQSGESDFSDSSGDENSITGVALADTVQHEVVVAINGRPLTTCDPDHGCCMCYYYYERKPGCTKGLAKSPKLCFSHCHPIATASFPKLQASKSLNTFVKRVERVGETGGISRPRIVVPVAGLLNHQSRKPTGSHHRNGCPLPLHNRNACKRQCISTSPGGSMEESTDGSEDEIMEEREETSQILDSPNMDAHQQDMSSDDIMHDVESSPPMDNLIPGLGLEKEASIIAIPSISEGVFHRIIEKEALTANPISIDDEPKLVLLHLSMIFGRMTGTPKEVAGQARYTEQLRRDTARCIMAEECSGKEVFTVDNREGDANEEGCVYRPSRHIIQDLNSLDFSDKLFSIISGRVSQVTLDYFWFSGRYWDTQALRDDFYKVSIPGLAGFLITGGAIYIPLCPQLFIRLLTHEDRWNHLLKLSLVHADDRNEIDMVKGSHCIPQVLYEKNLLGKKDQKPEVGLGTTAGEVRQTMSAHIGMPKIPERFHELVKAHPHPDKEGRSYYFMKLTKLN
jgi:hypothetical protein